LTLPLSAQKKNWTVGVNAGLKQEIYHTSVNNRNIICAQAGFSPQIVFHFSYYFHDNFAIESGLSYLSTKLPTLLVNTPWKERVFLKSPTTIFHSIPFPIQLSSSFSLYKNLKFYAKTGLALSFMLDDQNANMKLDGDLTGITVEKGTIFQHSLSYDVSVYPNLTCELLYHAGIGIGYEFPVGIGILLNVSFSGGFYTRTEILTSYGYLITSESWNQFSPGYENISFNTNYYSINLGFYYKLGNK